MTTNRDTLLTEDLAHGTIFVEFTPEALEMYVKLWNTNDVRNEDGRRVKLRIYHVGGSRWGMEASIE